MRIKKDSEASKISRPDGPVGQGLVKAGIIGGAGYTGGELIRLLINHPKVEIVFVQSKSNAGKLLHEVHSDMIGETSLRFSGAEVSPTGLAGGKPLATAGGDLEGAIDVLFLCIGHGEARKFLEENSIPEKIKIIDLSQDFRLAQTSRLGGRSFIYGLPELNKQKIQSAQNIANPGCFATSIQLGLLPLAKKGLLENIYTTGITGSTGAGQGLTATSHFSWRANNIQAYKTLNHQHLHEIVESLQQLQPSFSPSSKGGKKETTLHFIPWRGDFTRGIFISSQIDCDWKLEKLVQLYDNYYANHPFTILSQDVIFLKQVVSTNKCVIQLEKVGSKLVIHTALDNLLKGASGQAVQNMNLMFGIDECAGLRLKGVGF